MNTFNTTIRVLLAKRVMILIYVVALSCMMFGLSWSFAQQNAKADASTTYDSVRPTVAVVDRGTDGAGFSTSLQTFLAHDCDMVHVGSSDEDLQYAVASNYVDPLLTSSRC